MSSHLMLLPSLSCPASCAYCFGPHQGSKSMSQKTLEAAVSWQNALNHDGSLEITFHGGEPLLPGVEFYRSALPLLRAGLALHQVRFGIQSNLWLLTDELCHLFHEYDLTIGTSLDGPQAINDAQRGQGYFRRTMAGIELARSHALPVGCICTFTPQSAPYARQIFDFFTQEGLSFSIHAALPSLAEPHNEWILSPETHAQLLVEVLDLYLANPDKLHISTLDAMCRSISAGRGAICTFVDCLGEYLAVDPQGWIYPCQRFAGASRFRLGSVHQRPSWDALSASPVWQAFRDWRQRVEEECNACPHLDYCRGGCPYNFLAAGRGVFGLTGRDPHCPAYQRAFGYITDRALEEVFSDENLAAVVANSSSAHGLLRKGKLLHIMRGGPHPHEAAKQARKLAAAVALAASQSPEEALEKLDGAGLVTRRSLALQSLAALQSQLRNQAQGLINAYIHVTYVCNLACDHCYASSGPRKSGRTMPVEEVASLVRQAASAGFRKAIITGGEPLAHPQRDALLAALAVLRQAARPMQIVLRTNLAYPLAPAVIEKLAHSADQIVVSMDGDQASHDARRGAGAYARTLTNLHSLLSILPCGSNGGERQGLVLAATLTAAQMGGPEGEAVRALGEELGVGVRFKPVLPLGRAAGLPLAPEFYSSIDDGCEALVYRSRPSATCGLGMNLYVDPQGECFPCYALASPAHALGNALDKGLAAVLARDDAYRCFTVDSNRQCRGCSLRYLCGGFCRAWSKSIDPDDPPGDCSALHARVAGLLQNAMESLDVCKERWLAAGLPLQEIWPKVK